MDKYYKDLIAKEFLDCISNTIARIFDMHKDPVVLIGKDYWDTIGNIGTYEEVLKIAESVRKEARKIMDRYKP